MFTPAIPERFEILEQLPSSDAELLFRARDTTLLREVILKLPGAGLQDSFKVAHTRRRMLREARALAGVHHPGVARLLDVIETDAGPLLILEPTVGRTLAERLVREGRLPAEDVRALGVALADALHAVHAEGVVHRGLSSSSVVLRPDGSPILSGFFFAKFERPSDDSVPGTTLLYGGAAREGGQVVLPAHPAPEQLDGQRADARSDVFGLAWLLFECLTAHAPYPPGDPAGWTQPHDPRRDDPRLSKELVAPLLRCLAVRPLERLQSAAELRDALAAAAGAPAEPSAPKAGLRRVSAVATVAGAALLLGALGLRLGLRGGDAEAAGAAAERGVALDSGATEGEYASSYARSRALLIGIGSAYAEHEFARLPNAERDVDAVAAHLRALPAGWEVRVVEGADATRARILEELELLRRRAGRDDQVLLYYAGHGVPLADGETDQSAWILPADARSEEDDPGRSSWIRFGALLDATRELPAKHVLLAMDCCYSGRALSVPRSAVAQRYGERLLRHKARVVIASGRRDTPVSDGLPGEGSPFTNAFLHALQEADGPLTATGLYAAIRKDHIARGIDPLPTLGHAQGNEASADFVFFAE